MSETNRSRPSKHVQQRMREWFRKAEFVRFLKIGLADIGTTSQQFDSALEKARKIAGSQNITTEDIEEEIRAYRTKN